MIFGTMDPAGQFRLSSCLEQMAKQKRNQQAEGGSSHRAALRLVKDAGNANKINPCKRAATPLDAFLDCLLCRLWPVNLNASCRHKLCVKYILCVSQWGRERGREGKFANFGLSQSTAKRNQGQAKASVSSSSSTSRPFLLTLPGGQARVLGLLLA